MALRIDCELLPRKQRYNGAGEAFSTIESLHVKEDTFIRGNGGKLSFEAEMHRCWGSCRRDGIGYSAYQGGVSEY